jgi:hypothetical protein
MVAVALKLPPRHMTVSEFLDWNPEDGSGAIWQLRDGRNGWTPTFVGVMARGRLRLI